MRTGSSKGRLRWWLLWPSGVESVVIGFRTSRVVSSSLPNKRHLAARSVMPAISGLLCEGKWSQREPGGGGLGDRVVYNAGWRRIGGLRVEPHPSRGGCSFTKCLGRCLIAAQASYSEVLWDTVGVVSIWGFGPAADGTNRGGPVQLWSLGGPIAEAGTSEAVSSEEALERRARRTHCGRPGDNLVGAGCYLPFDFACVQHGWAERTQAGRRSQ